MSYKMRMISRVIVGCVMGFQAMAGDVSPVTISSGWQFKSEATVSRAVSIADSARCPKECIEDGLPNEPLKYGSMTSITRGSTGVVAA